MPKEARDLDATSDKGVSCCGRDRCRLMDILNELNEVRQPVPGEKRLFGPGSGLKSDALREEMSELLEGHCKDCGNAQTCTGFDNASQSDTAAAAE